MSKLRGIGDWSLPARVLLFGVVSALSGAGIVSFLVEFATYTYALSYGFRPPVEGIPYLRSTVTLMSLLLVILGAVAIAIMYLIVFLAPSLFFGRREDGTLSGVIPQWIRALSRRNALLSVLIASILVVCFTYLGKPVIESGFRPLQQVGVVLQGPRTWQSFAIAVVIGLWVMVDLLRNPSHGWGVILAYVLLIYSSVVFLLFDPRFHAGLLRVTGFGGGAQVVIQLAEHDTSGGPIELKTYLMLRTSEVLITFDPDKEVFREYPVDRVQRISYAAGGLHELPVKLPK
jgi:hypothetical protein